MNVGNLGLDAAAREKLSHIVGKRYNASNGRLTLVSRRFPTREMNVQHVKDLLTVITHEAKVRLHRHPHKQPSHLSPAELCCILLA